MKAARRMGRGDPLLVQDTEIVPVGTTSTKVLPSPEPPVVLTDQTSGSSTFSGVKFYWSSSQGPHGGAPHG